ncbi:hypothetical protein NX059_009866 [Plenodomus lindquistii]|nr:hypothetical protein NX059_009866 [Plenodomus lindquistii]
MKGTTADKTNGRMEKGYVKHQNQNPTKVWQSLQKVIPLQDRDTGFWWHHTGYHVACMVDASGYSIEKQYEVLLFHLHWICPRLGPAPGDDGKSKWHSLMAHDGSPLEYSWKWNTSTGKPDVRYSWEPFNPGSGRTVDPRNHALSLDYMRTVKQVLPGADFTWITSLLEGIESGDQKASHFLHAVEYSQTKPFGLKSYFLPRDYKILQAGSATTMDEWDKVILKLNPNNAGRDILMKFLSSNPQGKLLQPCVLAVDDVKPEKSRLKLYFMTPHTSFSSLREIVTLGGTRDVPESSFHDLKSFIWTLLGLPNDYQEDTNVPAHPPVAKTWLDEENLVECFVYFFDIAPHNSEVDIKFYLPTRRYGPDDRQIAKRLVEWMESRGRGAWCDRYLHMLERLAEHRGLENGKGLHSYISYQVGKGPEPDIKSYLTPETYHPARYALSEE